MIKVQRDFFSLAFAQQGMKKEIFENIAQKTGIDDLIGLLSERLSGSELNSLLMEVFDRNVQKLSPALLLKQYTANRFVQPAESDMIGLLTSELNALQFLQQRGFEPIELSPAAQLGACSVVASVDQKKVISATRNTEISADATNAIALHIASLRKAGKRSGHLHFCTAHRHIRTQPLTGKGHTAHFKIGCMVSSGRDTGSYSFECDALLNHFTTLDNLMRTVFGIKTTRFKLLRPEGYKSPDILLITVAGHLKKHSTIDLEIVDAPGANSYYKGIQFKMTIELPGGDKEIADGGFVDWTQQLLQNKKERLLISGFGLELLYKFQNGLIKL